MQEDLEQLEQLGSSLLAVWQRHRRSARMATPLLLAADLLLSSTGLRDLQPTSSEFPQQASFAFASLCYALLCLVL